MATIADTIRQEETINNFREAINDILDVKFGFIPKSINEKINTIDDMNNLKLLHRKAVVIESTDKFEESLNSQ